MQNVAANAGSQIGDVLLTALTRTCAPWAGSPNLRVDVEGHGREPLFDDVDLTRTVGWFTTIYPVALTLETMDRSARATPGASSSSSDRIPRRGIGYGLLRYLSEDATVRRTLENLPRPQISFNYLGQFGHAAPEATRVRPAAEAAGAFRSPRDLRAHELEISASVQDGRFEVLWLYSRNLHRKATIERLTASFVEELRSIIRACATSPGTARTPADFARARVSQHDLDKVLAAIGGGKGDS